MSLPDMAAARYLWLHDSLAIIDSSHCNIATILCGIQGHKSAAAAMLRLVVSPSCVQTGQSNLH
eukprot:3263073-Ditylum_brightwellii.AAC.1